ncbi:hypothetical protein ACWGS9_34510 [Bradyrhizobium sp. Arg314]
MGFDPPKILTKMHERTGQRSPARTHVVQRDLLADDEQVEL